MAQTLQYKNKEGQWVSLLSSNGSIPEEAIANFFDGVKYDEDSKELVFLHEEEEIAKVDVTPFIIDNFVKEVEIIGEDLVITFNTEDKPAIRVALADIFNPDNYYTKEEVEERLTEELYEESVDTNGHDFVNMGEAGIWATCNIGASAPEQEGTVFSHSDFESEDLCQTHMGGDWKVPSEEDVRKLIENTDFEFRGYQLILKAKDSDAELIFPLKSIGAGGYLAVGTSTFLNLSGYRSDYHATLSGFNWEYPYIGEYGSFPIRGFIPSDIKSPKYLTKQEASETFATKEELNNNINGLGQTVNFLGTSLTEKIESKENKFTIGTGLEMTENRVLNVTLDTKVFKVVDSLPDTPISGEENKIYLVPSNNAEERNKYDEYLYNEGWELIGQSKVEVDLSNYYTKEELKELVTLANEWKALKEEMAANPNEIVAFVNGELIPICNINSMILTKPIASTLEINNIEEIKENEE